MQIIYTRVSKSSIRFDGFSIPAVATIAAKVVFDLPPASQSVPRPNLKQPWKSGWVGRDELGIQGMHRGCVVRRGC